MSPAMPEQTIPQETEKQMLHDRLAEIEEKIETLRQLVFTSALQRAPETSLVQALIQEIHDDRLFIESLCIHRCDRFDPDISIQHDLLHNDSTASLYEHLAVAADLGVERDRIIALHQQQRIICKRLKELGIDVSRN